MIKTIRIDLTAGEPNLPLATCNVYAGSAASFTILNVPRAVGKRSISSIYAVVKNVDGVSRTLQAVRVGSAYEVTFPATHFSTVGKVANGVKVLAYGSDENAVAASWVLGVGGITVLDPSGTVTPAPSTKSEIYKEDFASVDALSNATLNQVSAKVNEILTKLKPVVVAILALLPLASAATLTQNTLFGDVPPTNTLAEVVAAGGGVSPTPAGGVSSNAVNDLIATFSATNTAPAIVAATNAIPRDLIADGTNTVKANLESVTWYFTNKYCYASGFITDTFGWNTSVKKWGNIDWILVYVKSGLLYIEFPYDDYTYNGDPIEFTGFGDTYVFHDVMSRTLQSGDVHISFSSEIGHYPYSVTRLATTNDVAISVSNAVSTKIDKAWAPTQFVGKFVTLTSDGEIEGSQYGSSDFIGTSFPTIYQGITITGYPSSHSMTRAIFYQTGKIDLVDSRGNSSTLNLPYKNGTVAMTSDLISLSGRTFDFGGGTNFTLRLYTALTNVIQTLGGSVTNAPTFETED